MDKTLGTAIPAMDGAGQDEWLEDELGMRDFEVRALATRVVRYLAGGTLQADVARTKRAMDGFLAGLSIFAFCFLVLFCYLYLGIATFLLFYIVLQVVVIGYWRLVESPLRHHGFPDAATFLRCRGALDQEHRLKAAIHDEKRAILVFVYVLLDAMVVCSILDAGRLLPYINNVIFDRGEFPDATINSLVPGLVIIGLVINVFGAFIASRYKIVTPFTGQVRDAPVARALISGLVLGSILVLVMLAIPAQADFAAFIQPAPGSENVLYYLDPDVPANRARVVVFLYYGLVYAGAACLAIMILLGFSVLESALLKGKVNRAWNRTPPDETNWEFPATVARQDKATRDKVAARKRALVEIGLMCLAMAAGMWLFLWYGGEVLGLRWMEYAGYAVIGIPAIWFMILSPFYHAKKDGKYHYPTAKHNAMYAWFDERGMGSPEHYFREVLGKKKSLVLWTTYWLVMLASVFNFREIGLGVMNWRQLFSNPATVPRGLLVDFGALLGVDPNTIALASILVVTTLSIVAFIAALGKHESEFKGSKAWCAFYKVLLGVVVAGCFFWVSKVPQVTSVVNVVSMDFVVALGAAIAFFAVVAVIAVVFIAPFIVKFDNLGAVKKEIILILISTIVLTWVIIVLFDFLLPMTGTGGETIIYGYPFRLGPDNEVSALLDSFDLGEFLMEWFGRYVAWGGVQQYLFMSYFLVLWKKAFPRSKGYIIALGTSCIFGVIHAIDWPLMLFTGIAGMMWAWYWNKEYYDQATGKVVRGNNLLLWGLVHGFGGSLLGMLMPFTLGVGPFNV